jgi:hypothetical protein
VLWNVSFHESNKHDDLPKTVDQERSYFTSCCKICSCSSQKAGCGVYNYSLVTYASNAYFIDIISRIQIMLCNITRWNFKHMKCVNCFMGIVYECIVFHCFYSNSFITLFISKIVLSQFHLIWIKGVFFHK